jgi:tRNA nucleotidyltransferase (CCA-adding enzyme)
MKEWRKRKMIPKQWQAATEVINIIEQAGFEAFIVGGAVRDYYLKKENNDVDIATSALPNEIQEIFNHTIDVGIEHGTVIVLDCGEPIEVTTFRTESTYSDHRRPDAVHFVRSLTEDLKRRDFTMNAMALNKDGDFIDYYSGRKDIDNRIIRAVGNPDERFREDALRMIRAIRFAAQLGFSIEPVTFQAVLQQSSSISFIAMERIQVEFSKIWISNNARIAIDYIQQTGLERFLPGKFAISDWQYFNGGNRQVGWAYFCFVNDREISLLTQYKCSNKDKLFAKLVFDAYDRLLDGWQSMDYFTFDLDILKTALHFAQWQSKQLTITFDDIAIKKNELPIQTRQQLAITGNDVIVWLDKKGGPWIKPVLDAALDAVVTGQVANDKQQLKEWFHAFNDEG